MFVARQCQDGIDAGKWYTVIIESRGKPRRAGYCALGCGGHASGEEALAHHLQYQLDRESDLWLDRRATAMRECEICGTPTTLRARLGRDTKLFVLCDQHQSSTSLQVLFRRRTALAPA